MEQLITFDKSLQERLREFQDVLSGYEVLPVSSIQNEWSYYLELTMDPNGWQAIWKVPRNKCESLKIMFPCIVLVFVLNVDFKNLQAQIRILAVQDDVHLPEKHNVPLIQLFVTKNQDKSIALNIQTTANTMDMLRFFYTNIFMPWDIEDDDASDWKSKHLESRLRLYYDRKNGIIPRFTAEHINSLLTEAKRLQVKQETLQNEISDSDTECTDFTTNKKLEYLLQLHVRMLELKGEVDILETPLLRKVIIKRQSEILHPLRNSKQYIWLISEEGTADEHINFLQKVKNYYPQSLMCFASNLANILEITNSNDIFILNESVHIIKATGSLKGGGTLCGISDRTSTIITSDEEDIMLDFSGDVLIKNLTVNSRKAQCTILVRSGKVVLENVKITGDGISTTHQGIIVLSDAQLELADCEIHGFFTAIVGNAGARISLKNCEVHHVNFGLKVYENCFVVAEKTTFHDCKDYGIVVETEKSAMNGKSGNFEALNIIPHVKTELISGENNAKGDVAINYKSKIRPVENLFENPDFDPTICEESDAEITKDYNFITIIENARAHNTSPVTL